MFINGTFSFIPQSKQPWILTHVLDPKDEKSRALIEHLESRGAARPFVEVVVFLSENNEAAENLEKAGFSIAYRESSALREAAPNLEIPFLYIEAPGEKGVYAGNYGKDFGDMEIAQSFYSQKLMRFLPTTTCGTILRVQKFLDPSAVLHASQSD